MGGKIIDGNVVDLEREALIDISKPLFYGFTFIAGVALTINPPYAGTLLGLAVLASLTFVSAALAEGMEDDWKAFLDLIAITALLMAVLFASYTSAALSML